MSFIKLAKERKSVRRYSTRSVPRDVIDRCLEAARLAPSACNSQPWSFIVIDSPTLKDDLATKAFSGIYSMNSFAKKAPVLIVVIRESSSYAASLGGTLRGLQYNLIDVGISCEHLVLQAEEEGLGTCWLGWFNEKAVRKTLKIPRSKRIDIIISLGYPESTEHKEKSRKTLEEIRKFA